MHRSNCSVVRQHVVDVCGAVDSSIVRRLLGRSWIDGGWWWCTGGGEGIVAFLPNSVINSAHNNTDPSAWKIIK